jgi:hypothetical protein
MIPIGSGTVDLYMQVSKKKWGLYKTLYCDIDGRRNFHFNEQ